MTIHKRLADADVLWAAGRREGALLRVLVAVTAIARAEHPQCGDGDAFLAARHRWSISVEHRGRQVSVDQLMWKWRRCELAHRATLPIDIQVGEANEDPDQLWIRAGGPPGYRVRLSTGWYHWLRRIASEA